MTLTMNAVWQKKTFVDEFFFHRSVYFFFFSECYMNDFMWLEINTQKNSRSHQQHCVYMWEKRELKVDTIHSFERIHFCFRLLFLFLPIFIYFFNLNATLTGKKTKQIWRFSKCLGLAFDSLRLYYSSLKITKIDIFSLVSVTLIFEYFFLVFFCLSIVLLKILTAIVVVVVGFFVSIHCFSITIFQIHTVFIVRTERKNEPFNM